MAVRWNKIVIWLILEISFNFLGIDEVVDCSEFLFQLSPMTNPNWVELSVNSLWQSKYNGIY